jgi:hypothetical protein
MVNPLDPCKQILLTGYTEAESLEIEALMVDWDQATYATPAHILPIVSLTMRNDMVFLAIIE